MIKSTPLVSLSLSQSAITGTFVFFASFIACCSPFGSQTIIKLGSVNFLQVVFVIVPGTNLPASNLTLTNFENFIAGFPEYARDATTKTSSGLYSAIFFAASRNISSVFLKYIWTHILGPYFSSNMNSRFQINLLFYQQFLFSHIIYLCG